MSEKEKESCLFCQRNAEVLGTVEIESGLGYFLRLEITGHGPNDITGKICASCMNNILFRHVRRTSSAFPVPTEIH